MYLIVTKTFPPEVGGMQNLMWGLANELSKHYMIKVYADYHENYKLFDETQNVAKSYDAVCTPDFFGYNNNLELQYRGRIRELDNLKPVRAGDSDLFTAMKQIAETGKGPETQIPSVGCSIKWLDN